MKKSKLNRFDQAFLTIFGSIGTIGPVFHRYEKEVAQQNQAPKDSK